MFDSPATVYVYLDLILAGVLALLVLWLLFSQRIPEGTVAYSRPSITVLTALCRVTSTTGTPTEASHREHPTDAHAPGVGDPRTMG